MLKPLHGRAITIFITEVCKQTTYISARELSFGQLMGLRSVATPSLDLVYSEDVATPACCKLRDNSASSRDSGTVDKFAGQSRQMWDVGNYVKVVIQVNERFKRGNIGMV